MATALALARGVYGRPLACGVGVAKGLEEEILRRSARVLQPTNQRVSRRRPETRLWRPFTVAYGVDTANCKACDRTTHVYCKTCHRSRLSNPSPPVFLADNAPAAADVPPLDSDIQKLNDACLLLFRRAEHPPSLARKSQMS